MENTDIVNMMSTGKILDAYVYKFKDHQGNEVQIFIEKGSEIYHRMALENQILIDSWKGIDKKIVT